MTPSLSTPHGGHSQQKPSFVVVVETVVFVTSRYLTPINRRGARAPRTRTRSRDLPTQPRMLRRISIFSGAFTASSESFGGIFNSRPGWTRSGSLPMSRLLTW